jgi:hypothetical protein
LFGKPSNNPAGGTKGFGSRGGPGAQSGKTEWEPKVVEPGDDLDCLDYCQSVVSSPSMPHRDRMQAAAILAPFRHLKPQERFLPRHIDLDPPKDINEAIEQRKKIMALKRVIGEKSQFYRHILHFRVSGKRWGSTK